VRLDPKNPLDAYAAAVDTPKSAWSLQVGLPRRDCSSRSVSPDNPGAREVLGGPPPASPRVYAATCVAPGYTGRQQPSTCCEVVRD
jgi:hypothetical protein